MSTTTTTDTGTRRFTLFSTAGLSIMLVLGLILGLLLGVGGGLATGIVTRPERTLGDTSAEAGFARDMSTHHAQAVAMAMIEYRRGTNGTLRQIAYDITLTQQGQIGVMDQWLRDWQLNLNGTEPAMSWMPDGQSALQDGLMPGMATEAEMAQLEAARGIEVDRLFLKLMIKHHLGGIHMVDGVLKVSNDSDVTWLAKSMKTGHLTEIATMQNLQKTIG